MHSVKWGGGVAALPPQLRKISTPLQPAAWESYLQIHPDQEFALSISSGLQQGFRIGFGYMKHSCKSAHRNMCSASKNPEVVEEFLQSK